MSFSQNRGRWGILCLGLLATVGATGCQSDVGGQTLPSPYYLTDDVQYFPPGAEFKLSREAAAMAAMKRDAALRAQGGGAPAPIPGAVPVAPAPAPAGAAAPAGVAPPVAAPVVP
jgi:hypothetical protein